MPKITYNKLVRDKIPAVIESDHNTHKCHKADQLEYKDKLTCKLQEEVREFVANPCEEEIADILEVIDALVKYHGFDPATIATIQKDKRSKRGGFEEGIILEHVIIEK